MRTSGLRHQDGTVTDFSLRRIERVSQDEFRLVLATSDDATLEASVSVLLKGGLRGDEVWNRLVNTSATGASLAKLVRDVHGLTLTVDSEASTEDSRGVGAPAVGSGPASARTIRLPDTQDAYTGSAAQDRETRLAIADNVRAAMSESGHSVIEFAESSDLAPDFLHAALAGEKNSATRAGCPTTRMRSGALRISGSRL